MEYATRELSPRTYPAFEKLAEKQGGCWCMHYQRSRPVVYNSNSPRPRKPPSTEEWKRVNRRDKKRLVQQGRSHAVLVYDGKTPVGWCQYGTRDELPRIDAGRNYRKVGPPSGTEKLWRITCFFVDRDYRGKGWPSWR